MMIVLWGILMLMRCLALPSVIFCSEVVSWLCHLKISFGSNRHSVYVVRPLSFIPSDFLADVQCQLLFWDADLWCLRNAESQFNLPRHWPQIFPGSVGTATTPPRASAAAVLAGRETSAELVSICVPIQKIENGLWALRNLSFPVCRVI